MPSVVDRYPDNPGIRNFFIGFRVVFASVSFLKT